MSWSACRSSQARWRVLVALSACIVPLAGLSFLPLVYGQSSDGSSDPIPLRRVKLGVDDLPKEMAKIRRGVLVEMSQANFEAKVRLAARATLTSKQGPQLVEARYRARLEGTALVGTGQWRILHGGTTPAIVPLESLNLAIREPRFENQEAMIGDLNGAGLGLLVEEGGPRSVSLDWTARGEQGPSGLRFKLETPACAVATLELDLPADQIMTEDVGDCQVSGPFPAEGPNRRLWKISFADRPKLYLTIRRIEGPGQPAPLLLVDQTTEQRINPDSISADYRFNLLVLHQGVRTLQFHCDPMLRPYKVTAPKLEKWELHPAPDSSTPNLLIVRLREPLQDGTVKIYCTAPTAGSSPSKEKPSRSLFWQSPDIHLLGAIPSGETLKLYLHPDIALEDWEPNGFRLIESKAESTQDRLWPHVLTLKGTGFLAQGDSKATVREKVKRPTARIPRQGADFRARTLLWWQPRIGQPQLTGRIHYEVVKGSLFCLQAVMPANWEVERVEVQPAGMLRDWSIRTESGRSMLTAQLQQPLVGGGSSGSGSCRLIVSLRQAGAPSALNALEKIAVWQFPNMPVPEARWHECALAVGWDDQSYQGMAKTTAPVAIPDEDGPWGKQLPKAYYLGGKGLEGTLELRARVPRIEAQCVSDVIMATGHVAVEGTLKLRVESGMVDAVDVYSSSPLTGKKLWTLPGGATGVRRFERFVANEIAAYVSGFGEFNPLHLGNLFSARAPGQWWRLTLLQPLRPGEQLALRFAYEVNRVDHGGEWDVPLVSIPGAARMEGVATLHLTSADRVEVKTKGLHEPLPAVPTTVKARTAYPWRTFRYSFPPATMVLHGQIPAAIPPIEPEISRASLTSYFGSASSIEHFRFQIVNWDQNILPVRLPREAQVLAIRANGMWLDRFAGLQRERDTDTAILKLPVPSLDKTAPGTLASYHQYEIIYSEPRSSFRLWDRVKVTAPSLPLEPAGFRHFCRFRPGVVPLLDGQLLARPGPNLDVEGDRALAGQERGGRHKYWAHLLFPERLIGRSILSWEPWSDWESRQREAMSRAEATLRANLEGSPPNDTTLGHLIEWLAFYDAHDIGSLVLDKAALDSAGLVPKTKINGLLAIGPSDKGILERIGLLYVPCRFGSLLTTREAALDWQTSRGDSRLPSLSIEYGIERAGRCGHDRAGRFFGAIEWLREAEESGRWGPDPWKLGEKEPETTDPIPLRLIPNTLQAGWTEWETSSHLGTNVDILVVQEVLIYAVGLLLVESFLVFALLARRLGWRIRFGLLLLWLAVSGIAYSWLPGSLSLLARWSFQAGLAIGFVWFLGLAIRTNRTKMVQDNKLVALGPVMLLWLIGMAGNAAPTDETVSNTVYEIPESKDTPNRRMVLAAPELLKQLETLARLGAAAPHGAVVFSANYVGKVADRGLEVEAEWKVQSFEDHLATIYLPLKGAQIHEDVLLDGARTYPVVEKAPKNGISLKMEGRGLHTVRMHFRVPVQESQDQRDVEFTAPRPPQSRLRLQLPAKAQFPQTPTRLGIQRVSDNADGSILEADLGHANVPIHLRWQQPTDQSRPPVVQTREAYLWSLRAGTSSMAARLEFTVNSGLVTRVELDLPDPLEVRSVSLEPGTQSGGVLGPRLKQWQLVESDHRRRLAIDFQNPIMGAVQVVLELVPRNGLGSAAILPVPAVHGWQPTLSICAYRLEGFEAEIKGLAHLTGMRSRDFVDFWKSLGGEEIPLPAGAYTIARAPDSASFLHLNLHTPATPLKAAQDLTWRVNRRQAALQAKARLTAPGGILTLVEWQVPEAVVVSKVIGRDVWNWSHKGSRLQVWLQQAGSASEVEFSGWSAVKDGDLSKIIDKGNPRDSQSFVDFEFPSIHPLGAQAQTTSVRIIAEEDLAIPLLTPNLLPLPTLRQPDQERIYLATKPEYGGRLEFRPIKPRIDISQATVAEIRDRRLQIFTGLNLQVLRGQARTLQLRLQNGSGMDVRLNGPTLTKYQEEPPNAGDRVWSLEFDTDFIGPHRLTLTASMPVEKLGTGAPLPQFKVLSDGKVENWVAVDGRDLLTDSAQGLAAVLRNSPDDLAWQKVWPEEAERVRRAGGSVWRAMNYSWSVRLLPRSRGSASAPIQVILSEQELAVTNGSHWVHKANCWLYHETNSDLSLSLPTGASITAVALDSVEVASFRQGSDQLWLPLSGSGISRLWLRWEYDRDAEAFEQPRLDQPHMEGVVDGPAIWTVNIPPSLEIDGLPDSLARGRIDLVRAEAQVRLSSILAELAQRGVPSHTAQLTAAQDRFYQYCRFAEYEIDQATAESQSNRQAKLDLLKRLTTLKDRNKEVATTLGFEKSRTEADQQGPLGQKSNSDAPNTLVLDRSFGGAGTPFYATADSSTSLPKLKLVTARHQHIQRAWVSSSVIFIVLTGLWFLSFFPRVLQASSWYWPELFVVLGCSGWFLVGPHPGFALVALVGAGGRLFRLGRGAINLSNRWGRTSLSPDKASSVRA